MEKEEAAIIISIRGTNGSGKSTVVQRLLKQGNALPKRASMGMIPEAYEMRLARVKRPVYVLGPYLNNCGGCDAIQPYEHILTLLDKYSKKGHVIFEGVLVSTTYGSIGEWMARWKKEAVFVFLNTKFKVCLERVLQRRGPVELADTFFDDEKPVTDERLTENVAAKFKSIDRVRQRVEAEGIMRSVVVDSDGAAARIHQLLQEAK